MSGNKPLIFVCSPYRGDVKGNIKRAREYCCFVIERGGVPFAPHLLFTQFLNDAVPLERDMGICLGLEALKRCDALWAFGAPSSGMRHEMTAAGRLGIPVVRIDSKWREVENHE